jgi:hypothetical protein
MHEFSLMLIFAQCQRSEVICSVLFVLGLNDSLYY